MKIETITHKTFKATLKQGPFTIDFDSSNEFPICITSNASGESTHLAMTFPEFKMFTKMMDTMTDEMDHAGVFNYFASAEIDAKTKGD